jgi:hypothetical protein
MNHQVVYKKAAIAGLIMAVIFLILSVMARIPYLGCIFGLLSCVGLLFVPGLAGAKAVHDEIGMIDAPAGAISAAISSTITVIINIFISTILTLFIGTTNAMFGDLGTEQLATGAIGVIMAIGIVIGVGILFIGTNVAAGAIYGKVKGG